MLWASIGQGLLLIFECSDSNIVLEIIIGAQYLLYCHVSYRINVLNSWQFIYNSVSCG